MARPKLVMAYDPALGRYRPTWRDEAEVEARIAAYIKMLAERKEP